MSQSDPIADMLAKIHNASVIHKECVDVPFSKVKQAMLEILKAENYIENLKCVDESSKKFIRVYLKYSGGNPAITGLQRRSRPGRRNYAAKDKIPYVLRGNGIVILSTSKGILTDRQAREIKVGGEILCYAW